MGGRGERGGLVNSRGLELNANYSSYISLKGTQPYKEIYNTITN